MTPYSHVMGRAGQGRAHSATHDWQTGPGRGVKRAESPRPLPHTCLQSAETVWSSNPPCTCVVSLPGPPGRVGQGGVVKTKNQTYPRRPRGDQVRPVYRVAAGLGLTFLGSTFPGLAHVPISQIGQFSLNSTPYDHQDPTSKGGCYENLEGPFSLLRGALPILGLRKGKSFAPSFIDSGLN